MKLKRLPAIGLACVVAAAAVFLANASWLRGGSGRPVLLAHRGLFQDFHREGLTMNSCTASRMMQPTHGFLENTIPSMRAAFGLGADWIELDVHPTMDGDFAVFHDWTLDCRTNGKGVTREQTMAYLKTLDIGYGYTADGGRTYPFRGKFVGAMPTLAEVAATFPDRHFFINIKSNDPDEADRLVGYMARKGVDGRRLAFYGGEKPMARLRVLSPQTRVMSRSRLKACAFRYLALGWSGRVPAACANSILYVPINLRWLVWGWPNLFIDRLHRVNAEAFVIGPVTRGTARSGSTAINDPRTLCPFIRAYRGGVTTDHVEVVGPALRDPKKLCGWR